MDCRRSSFSAGGGNCVQVRQDLAAMRDSKNPEGPELAVDLSRLQVTVKSGKLPHVNGGASRLNVLPQGTPLIGLGYASSRAQSW
jgi:hypothetical protein